MVVGALGPSSSSGIYLISACIVLSLCLCCVCSSMPWHCCPCRWQFLTFPFPLSPSCRLFLVQGLFLFICLFIHSFIYVFLLWAIWLLSVTGVQRGLWARGLLLDCELGRPVRCSRTLRCDCRCSSWAPQASSLRLWCGCRLDIKLCIYLFGIFIQAGLVWLSKAGLHCLYKW